MRAKAGGPEIVPPNILFCSLGKIRAPYVEVPRDPVTWKKPGMRIRRLKNGRTYGWPSRLLHCRQQDVQKDQVAFAMPH